MEFLYALLAILGILMMALVLFFIVGYVMICLGGQIITRSETDDDYNTVVVTYAQIGRRRIKISSVKIEED